MVSDNPKISIIIPIYNAESHLEECLISITNQTFNSFEVLLIDDGSIDNSKEVATEFERNDLRFHYFYQKNKGVSSARNKGLDFSKGEYIVFIDSDDTINSTFLENLFNGMEKQYDFVASGHIFINKKKNLYEKRVPAVLGEISRSICIQAIISDNSIYTFPWNKIYHENIIKKYNIRFDESISYGEDFLFLITYIMKCHSYLFIESTDYNYMQHDDSVTNNYSVSGITKRLTYLVAMGKGQAILPRECLEEKKMIKVKYNNFGLTIYRLMKKMKFPDSEIKKLRRELKNNYQLIKSNLEVRGKIKYYSCIFFPNITNLFIRIVRNENN
ncbi:glycosyltransferase family 2 protein [Enterococcus asini]|uniref:glycosyltransferase family 2 protein n=1 Tax=Enterococcus asini TaxID=57732 RepID=UPI0028908773|nr:glycosyltransferase family 2 protein [Enterococcus asini]MDT2757488.1 glycosyltransferase family 2 protein [Enterococcus asini]